MCATGIGQVKHRAGQVEIADLWMPQVGDAFGVSHVGVFPELLESLAGTGQFADECAQSGTVGIVGGALPQAPDGQGGRFVPIGKTCLAAGSTKGQRERFCPT